MQELQTKEVEFSNCAVLFCWMLLIIRLSVDWVVFHHRHVLGLHEVSGVDAEEFIIISINDCLAKIHETRVVVD